MPKKKVENASPQVTRLPLPISDSPLVIDLPDGQKIVIGKMQSGSVIEVATWRGTGRPDSRTNRLMMGINSGSAGISETSAQDKKVSEKITPNLNHGWKTKAISHLKSVTPITLKTISAIKSAFKNRNPIAAKIAPADESTSVSLSQSSDVDEWLQKVLEKSQKSAARAAQESSTPRKSASVKIKSAPSKRKK